MVTREGSVGEEGFDLERWKRGGEGNAEMAVVNGEITLLFLLTDLFSFIL